ncbi:TIGR02391 family protein [Streptomyces sp. NPDC057092]|uniref:TIGR02391 family protein n=1 Tax=Streptomyces sp. NPDC057092 TaxID=3346017 RepID=UPI003625BF14
MATYSADYLKRLLAAVERFEEVFERWMETQVESDHVQSRGWHPTVWTKDGQDEAMVRTRELDVAEAAGAAERAVAVTGAKISVAGVGVLDPIASWSLMSAPRALVTPQDVRLTAARVRGRLSTMIDDAKAASESTMPGFAPSAFHEVIWSAAAAHWTTHQYRVAVREASEALTVHWKGILGRNDVDDTVFWQQTLSAGEPESGKPKLAWPGDPTDKTNRSMRGGLEPLAKALNNLATGLNLTVRNVTTHTRDELTEQEGMERLAAYSYFARLLDQCEVRRSTEAPEST